MTPVDLRQYTVLYFPPVEWTGLYQRPQHLSIEMTRSFKRVIYIQPIGLRPVRPRDALRIWRHLRNHAKGIRKQERKHPDNLEVLAAPLLPLSGISLADRINARILQNRLLKTLQGTSPDHVLLWGCTPAPFLRHLFPRLNRTLFVFDWIDDYSLFDHLPAAVVETQDWFLRHADVVFATSSVLVQRAAALRTGFTYLFPNGVDFKHWQSASSIPGTSALQHIPHPIIGYFGTISHWIDREVILGISAQHPLWQFVFIGPRADDGYLDPVFSRPNCHWLDSQPYETLPGLAARFDVCWMPFRQTDPTEAINPVKIYEYLALGKPVVAPPLPDLIQLGPAVEFAVKSVEYEQLIKKMIHDDKKDSREDERRLQARRFIWSRLWQQAGNHVSESLSKYR